ncbi:hypothetical protein COCCADRAFT_28586 [Bipolaris zeicola 26-R-13]|uniref:Uncharacterized protein n=1 Tax=Cochliobolus carbonum (strain 26-R-13) TaxID=930089 RepID=W6XYX7_COCC2|nr:uncharacterized protein COCCADRAFT_28586 [Bipolaris zeicola 26-R-13]EUC30520.1 hypothetical protein COCCADRAFT_28586 [Bipolaris zeicola 26-R-13]
MCAIGALMGLEQDVATMLSAQVEELVQADEQDSLDCHRLDRYEYIMPPSEQTERTSHAHPIWLLQTKLLLIWFRASCGNPYVVTDALKEFGFLVNAYWDRMSDVRADPHFDKHRISPYSDWHSWCQFELTKRYG